MFRLRSTIACSGRRCRSVCLFWCPAFVSTRAWAGDVARLSVEFVLQRLVRPEHGADDGVGQRADSHFMEHTGLFDRLQILVFGFWVDPSMGRATLPAGLQSFIFAVVQPEHGVCADAGQLA